MSEIEDRLSAARAAGQPVDGTVDTRLGLELFISQVDAHDAVVRYVDRVLADVRSTSAPVDPDDTRSGLSTFLREVDAAPRRAVLGKVMIRIRSLFDLSNLAPALAVVRAEGAEPPVSQFASVPELRELGLSDKIDVTVQIDRASELASVLARFAWEDAPATGQLTCTLEGPQGEVVTARRLPPSRPRARFSGIAVSELHGLSVVVRRGPDAGID